MDPIQTLSVDINFNIRTNFYLSLIFIYFYNILFSKHIAKILVNSHIVPYTEHIKYINNTVQIINVPTVTDINLF